MSSQDPLGDVRALEAENYRLKTALRYIACPTMGFHGVGDPETFAREEASDHSARLALQTCIRTACAALKEE